MNEIIRIHGHFDLFISYLRTLNFESKGGARHEYLLHIASELIYEVLSSPKLLYHCKHLSHII